MSYLDKIFRVKSTTTLQDIVVNFSSVIDGYNIYYELLSGSGLWSMPIVQGLNMYELRIFIGNNEAMLFLLTAQL